jgi:hypothetical protein
MTLAVINPADSAVHKLDTPYASFGNISVKEVHMPTQHMLETVTCLCCPDCLH